MTTWPRRGRPRNCHGGRSFSIRDADGKLVWDSGAESERFLADDNVLTEIANTWPQADIQYLRQLRRNALKEHEAGKPPKSFRAIFQALKELEGDTTPPTDETMEDGDE